VQYAINFPILNIHAGDGRNGMAQNKRGTYASQQATKRNDICHLDGIFDQINFVSNLGSSPLKQLFCRGQLIRVLRRNINPRTLTGSTGGMSRIRSGPGGHGAFKRFGGCCSFIESKPKVLRLALLNMNR
jgi:hypothetical protein